MSENKVVWHQYPKEMPDIAGGEKYLVIIKYKRKAKIKIEHTLIKSLTQSKEKSFGNSPKLFIF